MLNLTGRMALAAALAVAIPMTAAAQQDPRAKHGAAPRAAPARPAAPAARPAAPQPRAAPQVAAPRAAAPQVARPQVAPQVARPQVARPQAPRPHMSTPHVARPSAPNVPRQNFAAPQRHQAPAVVNRNVQQQRHVQQRQLRVERQRQRASAAQAKPSVPNAQAKQNVPNAQVKPNVPNAQSKTNVPNAQAKTDLQTQRQEQLNTQQQLRAERALQRREDRELRRLPAAQRAQRREEIQNARQQRALARQQLVQPNAAQSNARERRAIRRNDVARVTPDAARRGRFASAFAAQNTRFGRDRLNGRDRLANLAAHRAWRQGQRAVFVAWFGPVFWPYAYSDVFDYTFWPAGYDDGYWAYVYDDFFDGVFWGEAGPPAEYAYAAPYPRSSSGPGSAFRPSYAAVRDLCTAPGSGVTAWPFADIERKVRLNGEQKELLADVRKASQDAAAVFKASCPPSDTFPLTAPGRLDAMTARLEATLQAVQTVRPALEAFYASLSDEQKERFNELGPKQTAANAEARAASETTNSCKQPKPGLANLPIEKIEDVLNPTDAQEAELKRLQDATSKAVEILQAACPDDTPLTPPGRLDAMEMRLQSMIDAAKTVKPALASFYSSLSGEQKARFNRIGQQLSANN
jgi:LTXXQ motif family protein